MFAAVTLGQLAGSSEGLEELKSGLPAEVKSVVECDDAEVEAVVREARELVRNELVARNELGQADA